MKNKKVELTVSDGFIHIGKPKKKTMAQLIKEELKKGKFQPYRAGHGKGWN